MKQPFIPQRMKLTIEHLSGTYYFDNKLLLRKKNVNHREKKFFAYVKLQLQGNTKEVIHNS